MKYYIVNWIVIIGIVFWGMFAMLTSLEFIKMRSQETRTQLAFVASPIDTAVVYGDISRLTRSKIIEQIAASRRVN